jgi:hypothetical protein
MRKICKKCGKVFFGRNREVRCTECQKEHRAKYNYGIQKTYYPKSALRDKETHQWYQAMKDLSITECKFMLQKYAKDEKTYSSTKRISILKEIMNTRLMEREFEDEFLQE